MLSACFKRPFVHSYDLWSSTTLHPDQGSAGVFCGHPWSRIIPNAAQSPLVLLWTHSFSSLLRWEHKSWMLTMCLVTPTEGQDGSRAPVKWEHGLSLWNAITVPSAERWKAKRENVLIVYESDTRTSAPSNTPTTVPIHSNDKCVCVCLCQCNMSVSRSQSLSPVIEWTIKTNN